MKNEEKAAWAFMALVFVVLAMGVVKLGMVWFG